MNSEIFLLAGYAGTAAAAAGLTYLFFSQPDPGELVTEAKRRHELESPLLGMLLRFARMLAPLFAGTANSPAGLEMDRVLRKAGRPLGMTVPEYQAMRVVAALFGVGFGLFATVAVWDSPDWMLALVFGGLGFFYVGNRVKTLVAYRQRTIFRDMPYVLDMLTLSTEAGQDFSSAMATVIEKGTPGPLLDEFKVVHQEVTLGKTRADALRGMAARIDLPEVSSFVLALIQAEQLGTSIGKVLRIMAEQMRVKRSTIAEELAGKVPVKLMAPLVTCIVPAAFIILLFGPVYMYVTGQELK